MTTQHIIFHGFFFFFLSLFPLLSCRPLYKNILSLHISIELSFSLLVWLMCIAYSAHKSLLTVQSLSFSCNPFVQSLFFLSRSLIFSMLLMQIWCTHSSMSDLFFFLYIRQPIYLYFILFTHPGILFFCWDIAKYTICLLEIKLFLFQMLHFFLTRNLIQSTSKRFFSLSQPVGLKRSNSSRLSLFPNWFNLHFLVTEKVQGNVITVSWWIFNIRWKFPSLVRRWIRQWWWEKSIEIIRTGRSL